MVPCVLFVVGFCSMTKKKSCSKKERSTLWECDRKAEKDSQLGSLCQFISVLKALQGVV